MMNSVGPYFGLMGWQPTAQGWLSGYVGLSAGPATRPSLLGHQVRARRVHRPWSPHRGHSRGGTAGRVTTQRPFHPWQQEEGGVGEMPVMENQLEAHRSPSVEKRWCGGDDSTT
jgi:hypothetical protein